MLRHDLHRCRPGRGLHAPHEQPHQGSLEARISAPHRTLYPRKINDHQASEAARHQKWHESGQTATQGYGSDGVIGATKNDS